MNRWRGAVACPAPVPATHRGRNADREVDQEERPEEAGQAEPGVVAGPMPEGLHDRDERPRAPASAARIGSGRSTSSRTGQPNGGGWSCPATETHRDRIAIDPWSAALASAGASRARDSHPRDENARRRRGWASRSHGRPRRSWRSPPAPHPGVGLAAEPLVADGSGSPVRAGPVRHRGKPLSPSLRAVDGAVDCPHHRARKPSEQAVQRSGDIQSPQLTRTLLGLPRCTLRRLPRGESIRTPGR